MTDNRSHPLRYENTGERITRHLAPGENAVAIVQRMTLKRHRVANVRRTMLTASIAPCLHHR